MASPRQGERKDGGIEGWVRRQLIVEVIDDIWQTPDNTLTGYHFELIFHLYGGRLLGYGDKAEHPNGIGHHAHLRDEIVEIKDEDFIGIPRTRLRFYKKAARLLAELAVTIAGQGDRKMAKKVLEVARYCEAVGFEGDEEDEHGAH